MDGLADFHPAIRTWFERRFPEGPTDPQAHGWPSIAAGDDTLIAAPTGSGKTLAAFLVVHRPALPRGARPSRERELETEVVYVSPLKALAADIQQNLERPLAEIRAGRRASSGWPRRSSACSLRTGDTPSSARAAMLKRRRTSSITTPESLYLLRHRRAQAASACATVRTVIVDEIHAVARDKRGAHLALTLERLDALASGGRSASACPPRSARSRRSRASSSARARRASGPTARRVPRSSTSGIAAQLDLAIELPDSELEAVASHEQWGEILDRIAAHVAGAPHDARLREHAPAGRARRAPARRAPGRGPAWRRTTAACRRTGGSRSRSGSGRAT